MSDIDRLAAIYAWRHCPLCRARISRMRHDYHRRKR